MQLITTHLNFNIILSSTPAPLTWSASFRFPFHNIACTSLHSNARYMSSESFCSLVELFEYCLSKRDADYCCR